MNEQTSSAPAFDLAAPFNPRAKNAPPPPAAPQADLAPPFLRGATVFSSPQSPPRNESEEPATSAAAAPADDRMPWETADDEGGAAFVDELSHAALSAEQDESSGEEPFPWLLPDDMAAPTGETEGTPPTEPIASAENPAAHADPISLGGYAETEPIFAPDPRVEPESASMPPAEWALGQEEAEEETDFSSAVPFSLAKEDMLPNTAPAPAGAAPVAAVAAQEPLGEHTGNVVSGIADRLETIAASLRGRSIEETLRIWANSTTADPLELLVCGFVLGATQQNRVSGGAGE